jgi:hypothetical protein
MSGQPTSLEMSARSTSFFIQRRFPARSPMDASPSATYTILYSIAYSLLAPPAPLLLRALGSGVLTCLLRTGLNRLNPERYRLIPVWGKALPTVEVIPFPVFLAIMGWVPNVVHHP